VLLACLSGTLFFLTENLHIVSVTDSDGACRLVTAGSTDARTLLSLAGMEAGAYDRVTYTAYSENLSNLNIQRAFSVTVEADGGTAAVSMTQGTVGAALAQAGITLGEHDYTEPSLFTELAAGDTVAVHRVSYQDSVAYEAIPYETEYSYTSEFYKSRRTTITMQTGADGQRSITSRERWVDGVLESSQVVGTEITLAPRTQIIRAYKAGAPVSSRAGPDGTTNPPASYRAVYTGRATGYYSDGGGRGASGLGLRYGTVAVNPAVIPYGTLLYIVSTDGRLVYGYAIATDTGGALMNGTALVDLYYETYEEAYLNGAKIVNVYVVG
jgi:3D (Asp-Asp-Asp) domain-containing protein